MFPPQLIQLLDIITPIIAPVWNVIKLWWWLPLPFILWRPFIFLYLWWRNESWLKNKKSILIEIKMPKDILKPIRAMQVVLLAMRQVIYQPPDWWEKWIEGQVGLSYSLEIAGIDGEPHFFIRMPEGLRDSVEAAIYSQYPDAEISLAEDYTKNVPQDIPNENWGLWGADYVLLRPDSYPIRTYMDFESEREAKEEKRIDPMAGLLEAMTRIKKGEQLWIQMLVSPVTPNENPWIKNAEKLRDELARRTTKAKPRKALALEVTDVLISGEVPEEKKKEEGVIPPEMRLTSGEKEVVDKIERKIAKPGFDVSMRFVFLGRKGIFNKGNLRLPFGFFAAFGTENLNYLIPWGKTLTKVHKSWFLPLNYFLKRRLYLKERRIFRYYVNRYRPMFPLKAGKGKYVLNTEELASLYHFPGKSYAPAPFVSRIESKKGEAPPGLPTE